MKTRSISTKLGQGYRTDGIKSQSMLSGETEIRMAERPTETGTKACYGKSMETITHFRSKAYMKKQEAPEATTGNIRSPQRKPTKTSRMADMATRSTYW